MLKLIKYHINFFKFLLKGTFTTILLFSAFSSLKSKDFDSQWPYQHVDKNAGLSNSAITSVFMDQFDNIWMGSWDGVNLYDGNTIKVYKPDPFKKGSISNNVIRGFLEDKQGNLWIVTHLGINRYLRDRDAFKAYFEKLDDLPFQEYNLKACIGPDSVLWISQIGKGISFYNQENDIFTEATFKGIEATWFENVVDLAYINDSFFMLGRDGLLTCSVNQKVVFTKKITEPNQVKFHKFLKINDKAYLATSRNEGGILLFDLSSIEAGAEVLTLDHSTISSLSESLHQEFLWAGTENGGVFKIEIGEKEVKTHNMSSYMPQFSQSRVKILCITETQQDLTWIGTDGDGVYKLLTKPKAFYSISAGDPKEKKLSHNIVRSIYEHQNGDLYIGTRGGGLNILQINENVTKTLNTYNGLKNDAILSIQQDQKGNTWIGTDGEGIQMIDAITKKIFHFPEDFKNKDTLNLNFGSVYSICVDAFNNIWLGTSGFGVIQLQVSRNKDGTYNLKDSYQLTYSLEDRESIKSNIVYSIVQESPNILWFGTRGAGIYRFNTLSRKIDQHFDTQSEYNNRLSNDDVLSLYIDAQEQLWIGTSGGLNRLYLSYRPYRINHYIQNDAIANNTVHCILEDDNENIWVSTNAGISLFERNKNDFRNFDTKDGLKNKEFTDGAAFKSKISEKLYFGGIDGLDIIYPSKVDTANYFPRIAMKEFQVHNVIIRPGDHTQILKEHIDLSEKISLKHDQNFISFHFTTLDYWDKRKSEYAYFLENFDKDWNFIKDQSIVNLTNIPPGTYKLHINFSNKNGEWNPVPKTIDIIVTPPFWQTNWAYAIYALLLILFQVMIVLYIRERAKVKKEQAIDKFKIHQLKELNDYKLQFFTNLAHEFRTPLTLILGPASNLINKFDTNETEKEPKDQVKIIYSNALRLQKLIEELMQFRKIESGKESLEVSHIDLVGYTKELVSSFEKYATIPDIHLEFHADLDEIWGWVDINKVEKMLLNLISNAIKYNSPGGMVKVIVEKVEKGIKFIVKDNGQGIPDKIKNQIFNTFFQNPEKTTDQNGFSKSIGIGLSLTKSLVALHKGEIFVESEEEKGSTFTILLPIRKEEYPQHNERVIDDSLKLKRLPLEFEIDLNGMKEVNAQHKHDHTYSLLVVEDNPQIIQLISNLLKDGYNIYSAINGMEALKVIEKEKIDLVISDIMMPKMDGLTFCKELKNNIQTSHIPIILLTAKADIEHRIEGLQVGADAYISKPFLPEHLLIRVKKLIESREVLRKRFVNMGETEVAKMPTGISEKEDKFFLKITECIENMLNNSELNADHIATEVGMSKASLYKKVKSLTGLTPHGLIKEFRLVNAAKLLLESDLSVSEIIHETGFNSRSYFYKSFNEKFHCHPKDYASREHQT